MVGKQRFILVLLVNIHETKKPSKAIKLNVPEQQVHFAGLSFGWFPIIQ